MKAIVYTRYGSPDVLHLQEVAKPTPKDDEVLIQVYASSINSRDWRMLRANPFFVRFMVGGVFRPKWPILGADVAGRVVTVGKAITQFQPGDAVFGYLSLEQGGAYAEYVCAREVDLVHKPENVTFDQAAAVPLAAMTALQGLRDKGNIQPGQKVLINGASGGVGSFAVQLAKAFGAEVTAVCSTRNVEMVRALGADHVIDYKKEDFTKQGQRYDLILAANGYHPIAEYLRALTPAGHYVVAGGAMAQLFQAMWRARQTPKAGGQQVAVVSTEHKHADLVFLKELLEAGKIMPVIDRCYALEKTAQAFWDYENQHAKGKIVITVAGE